jgi:hypothetical protein
MYAGANMGHPSQFPVEFLRPYTSDGDELLRAQHFYWVYSGGSRGWDG